MEEKPPSFILSVRFLIAVVAFFGYAVQYIQRIDMSVAIVCMVNNTALKQMADAEKNHSLISSLNYNASSLKEDKCYFKELAKGKSLDGEFLWGKKIQGLILSSYFYGYLTTQVLGGFLSIKLGAKIVLAAAILVGSVLTLLIPVAANWSYIALVICRFFTGVAHGSFWPAMSTLWSFWAPPTERSRLAGIANAGAQIGNVVALPVGGLLCIYGFAGGWPSIFYVFGAVGIVWFIVWMIVAARNPTVHRFISEREREYVLNNTKEAAANSGSVPFEVVRKMVVSKAFIGVLIAHTSSNFGTYLFLTQLPTYMKEVLKFDIKSNGGLSALPYIAFWFFTIISSIAGDKIVQSKKLSKTAVRKIFNTLGFILPMGAVFGLAFVTCAVPYLGVALLTLGLAFTGCAYGAGFMVNYNDIGGSFAGLSFGMSNTVATTPGFIAPLIVGALTTHQKQEEWMIVFFITAAVYLAGALGFILFGSGELQEWAMRKPKLPTTELEETVPLQNK